MLLLDSSYVSMDTSLYLTGHQVGIYIFLAGSAHLNGVSFFMT